MDHMEVEAVNYGIWVAQNANFMPIILELDSKEIVDLSCNRKGSKTQNFWIIDTIQARLRSLAGVQL